MTITNSPFGVTDIISQRTPEEVVRFGLWSEMQCSLEKMLEFKAFHYLDGSADPAKKIASFIDGFFTYTNGGESDCLLAILSHHSTAGEEIAPQQQAIAEQFADWHTSLTIVFESAGVPLKKAEREAHDLVAALYGALLMTKMHNQPQLFVQAQKRLKKRIKKRFQSL